METKKSRKDINKEKVIKVALKSFAKNGIENSKVSDIAIEAGITERSAFRYFETKNDLVLATALLFWNNAVEEIGHLMENEVYKMMNGIEQVKVILSKYADLYFTSKQELIFCDEAETYLNRCGKIMLLKNRPPINYELSKEPLANAIKKGIEDGTIKNDPNIKYMYLNTYDSLLGFLQKLALSDTLIDENVAKTRLNLFIDSLIEMYKLK